MTANDRLFVPLASDPFAWFQSGVKKWELRKVGRSFTEKHVRVGRAVELRKGYNTLESIWSIIDEVRIAGSIAEFFDAVPYLEVIPCARSQSEAVTMAVSILRTDGPVIGFRCFP